MNNSSPARKIIDSLVEYRKWWLAPTLVCTVLAIGYALFSEKSYTSRQSLIVRDDLVGTFYKPGRFDSLDLMKSAQETILEISRRPQVVRAAMKRLGPPGRMSEASWLGDENLENMQGEIQISAPNGAEFGRTEAIVLAVNQDSRERAGNFVSYLLDEMEDSLRDLRSTKFSSMQEELEQAATLAEKSYLSAADKLKLFEKKIGLDLSTLISLNDAQAGTNNLQSDLANLSIEKRKAWSEMEKVRKQIQILTNIAERPESILEVPQELLQLQPTLTSLAQGLNEADLAYSKSRGRYQAQHPKVREAYREIVDIKDRIKAKLTRSLGSLSYQLESREDKYDRISHIVNEKQSRLGELSSKRVDYTTLRQEVDKMREIYAKAQASLSEIVTLGTSAKKVSLISRIDEPQTELYPDGPSNKAVVFGGMIAGLMIGMGLVMFVTPIDDPENPSPFTRSTSAKRASNQDSTRTQGRPFSQRSAPEAAPKPSPEPVAQRTPTDQEAPAVSSISEAIRQHQAETSRVSAAFVTGSKGDVAVEPPVQDLSTIPDGSIAETEQDKQPMAEELKPVEANESRTEASTFVELGQHSQPEQDATAKFEQAPKSGSEAVEPIASTSSDLPGQIVKSEFSKFESDYDSKSAAEIAAEITGSLSANVSVEHSTTNVTSGVVQRDEFFSGGTHKLDDKASDFSSLIEEAQKAAEDFLDGDADLTTSVAPAKHDTASSQMNREIDIPRIEVVSREDVGPSVPVVEESEAEFKTSALPLSQFDADSESESTPLQNSEGLKASTEIEAVTPDHASSGKVFSTLYEDGAAQILESANVNFADPDAEEFDLSSLRIGKEDHRILSEKLNQLGQTELESEDTGKTPVSSIDLNAVVNPTGQADEPPSAIQAGEPLTTSIESSPFATEGYESGPQSGQQPDNRPTATTVDLRMLKQQLAGSRRDAEDSKPLSQLLGKGVHESDVPAPDEKPVDQSIADLANSIREICQNKDQEQN